MHSIPAAGVDIPAIGFGTWRLLGEECARMVETAIGLGYRHIDTAAMYDNEVEVGRGVAASGVARDQLFVTTKVWQDDLEPDRLTRSIENSLSSLGLAYVDLFLIHWPSDSIPLGPTMQAMAEVKRRGLTRAIGVANFPSALLDEAVGLCPEPLAANQVEYHPYLSQRRLLETCRRHGISLTAYCPLARGALADDPVLAEIGAAHEASVAQVALRWLVQQPGVAAIPKSAHPGRAKSNLDIDRFTLSEAEMARISALARPDGRAVSPSFAPLWDRD